MRSDSYWKIAGQVVGLAVVMAVIAVFGLKRPAAKSLPVTPVSEPLKVARKTEPKPSALIAASAPILDEKAIALAEADLASAKNDADRTEARLAEGIAKLKSAQARAAAAAQAHKTIAVTIRDPSPRLRDAKAKGEVLKVDRDKLRGELMAFSEAPRPRRKPLIDKSPVAKKSDGEEFHFEIRGDRVSFIDLERLLDKVKTDARVKIRLSNGIKPAAGTVGPVGAFDMTYEVQRVDDGSNARMGNFGLSAWEIVPSFANRGETFQDAMRPASDFARAVRRLNPAQDVVTLWVYPNGFPLYRQIREALHSQGYLVAARPLPEGTSIRGSPSGSSSSAQ